MTAGIAASLEENVVIAAGRASITLLPQFGGKIASLTFRGRELLQEPLIPIASRTADMTFDTGDASGWDECLPSVAACTVPLAGASAEVPDHGDLWRVSWSVIRQDGNSITLAANCFSLPLALERTLTLSPTGVGALLELKYKVTNTGSVDTPWSWAAHPLFAATEGDRIVLPETIRSVRLEGSGGNRLGYNGDTVSWPVALLADGSTADLSAAQAPGSGIGDKLFAGPLSSAENWCALERPSVGTRIRVSFNTKVTPYLGLWICYGGWPDRSRPKQMCVAMEPSTAPVDSLASTGTWSRTLAPGAWSVWPMQVDLEIL